MGKKKAIKDEPLPPRMIIRLSERRKERYVSVAEMCDLTLSEWVRRVLDAECDRVEETRQ